MRKSLKSKKHIYENRKIINISIPHTNILKKKQIIELQKRIRQIMKIQTLHASITRIMKI